MAGPIITLLITLPAAVPQHWQPLRKDLPPRHPNNGWTDCHHANVNSNHPMQISIRHKCWAAAFTTISAEDNMQDFLDIVNKVHFVLAAADGCSYNTWRAHRCSYCCGQSHCFKHFLTLDVTKKISWSTLWFKSFTMSSDRLWRLLERFENWIDVVEGIVNFLSDFSTCKDYFPRDKYQQDYPRFDHSVN